MKYSILPVLLIASGLVLYTGCKDPEKPAATPDQLQLEKLAGDYESASSKSWSATSVIFDGIEDRTSEWAGFTITISGNPTGTNGYTTTGAISPGPWPSSGTWKFGGTVDNPNVNKIIRDTAPNELDMAVTVNATQLVLTFTYDDATHIGGRTEVVNGEYSFTFSAN